MTPKLFEFPDGCVIDLNEVYAISNLYTLGNKACCKIFFKHSPQSPAEFTMGEKEVEGQRVKSALVNRWGMDK